MLKKLSFLIVSFIALLGFNSPTINTNEVQFELIEIPSPSLEKALINPSKTYKIGVNLPPSYHTSEHRYPVVYHLSGYTVYPGQYPSANALNKAIQDKGVQEMILIDISGFNIFKGTMYANSPVTGNWEDFVTKDVIKYIDEHYRTIPERTSRGISGHSMGGGGCTNISLKHSDKFAVAYPMSPAITKSGAATVQYMFPNDSTMMFLNDLENKIGNVSNNDFQEALLKEFDIEKNSNVLWILGYGMAFAPDTSAPLKMSLPYDRLDDGSYVKNEANFAKWANGFGELEQKIKTYKQNLLAYEHYSIDCGYYDEIQFIIDGTKRFDELLSENNIPHSTHWYNGDHSSKFGDQMVNRVLPIMSVYLKGE